MEFVLKHYKKSASIQLKPKEDISTDPARCVHFSIAYFKNVNLSKEVQRDIINDLYEKLRIYLEKVKWKMNFRIIKACENCTYGHFDDEFENIIKNTRLAYPLCDEKNLPLNLHPELPQDDVIMFHIAHSRSTDESFNQALKKHNNLLLLQIEPLVVNK